MLFFIFLFYYILFYFCVLDELLSKRDSYQQLFDNLSNRQLSVLNSGSHFKVKFIEYISAK